MESNVIVRESDPVLPDVAEVYWVAKPGRTLTQEV